MNLSKCSMPSLVAAQEPVERKNSRYPGNQNIPRKVKSLGVRPAEDSIYRKVNSKWSNVSCILIYTRSAI